MAVLNASKKAPPARNSDYPTPVKPIDETPPEHDGEVAVDEKDDASANLKMQIIRYQRLQAAGDERTIEAEAQRVAEAMRHVGDRHTDEETRKNWYQKAEDFYRGDATERAGVLGGIGKGLLIIVGAPIALAAAGVFTAGAVIYGVGTLVRGIGTAMTGGIFEKRRGGGSVSR